MDLPVAFSEKTTLSLELACYHAVHDYPGKVAAVAAVYGWNPRTLSNKLNPTQNTHKLLACEVEGILELTRDGRIMDAMCARFPATWIDLQDIEGVACDMAMLDNITTLMQKVGELSASVHKSLADGVVDDAEMRDLEKCASSLTRATHTVIERAKQFMVKNP